MFITRLVLHRCKRFHVRGIETFEITPQLKTQIILGTNGSGKSSLLRVGFTVMPPSKDDFHPGGYKIIRCLKNGNEYELRTIFEGKSPEHHFYIVHGDELEDLNPGRTGSTQKELIKEHFGMTQELHEVLTGQTKFTAMSALERRDWITRLSSADFDYVIRLHGRVKKAIRAAQSFIDRQSGRLINETAKKLDDSAILELNQQSKMIRDQLAELFTQLNPIFNNTSYEDIAASIAYANGQISERADRMMKIKLKPPVEVTGRSLEEIQEQVDELKAQRGSLNAALQEVSEQYQIIDKQLHEVSILDGVDPVELQSEIAKLEAEIAEISASMKTGLPAEQLTIDPRHMSAVDDVIAALHAVIPGGAETFTREEVYKQQQVQQDLQDTYRQGTARISEIEYRLNHIASCSDVRCPNCSHTFKEGVNKGEEEDLRETLRKGQNFKRNMEEKLAAVRDYLDRARSVSDSLHELDVLRDQHPYLAGLWNLFGQNGGVARGRELVPVCRDYLGDCNKALKIHRIRVSQLASHIEKLNQIEKMDKSGSLREVHANLTHRMGEIQQEMGRVQAKFQIVQQYYWDRKNFANDSDQLSQMITEQEALFEKMVDFTFDEEVRAAIKKYQVSLAMLESSLTEAEMQAGIVRDISNSIDEAKMDEDSLIMLEKILSPKDGIIAEQILVFINTFISDINDVIGSVWGYNLALDQCDLEDGEMTYKFPMFIHTRDNLIPDIKFGSDSIIDIVNQAFRLVVYKLLGLDGYPLYLDEPARAFDAVHSGNLIMTMKEYIDDEKFSQVFYISHDYEGQNSFPNSQIAVMDESHVTLKRRFNEHVVIT